MAKRTKAKDWRDEIQNLKTDNPLHFKIGTVLKNPHTAGYVRVEVKKDGLHISITKR
jgi:hypothetical protein